MCDSLGSRDFLQQQNMLLSFYFCGPGKVRADRRGSLVLQLIAVKSNCRNMGR